MEVACTLLNRQSFKQFHYYSNLNTHWTSDPPYFPGFYVLISSTKQLCKEMKFQLNTYQLNELHYTGNAGIANPILVSMNANYALYLNI